jgi:hypothetical protein
MMDLSWIGGFESISHGAGDAGNPHDLRPALDLARDDALELVRRAGIGRAKRLGE